MQNQKTKSYQAAAGLFLLLAGISMLILPFVTGAGLHDALLPLMIARMQLPVIFQAAIASAMIIVGILVLYRRSVRTLNFADAALILCMISLRDCSAERTNQQEPQFTEHSKKHEPTELSR